MDTQTTSRLTLRALNLDQLRALLYDRKYFKQELAIELADNILDENVQNAVRFVLEQYHLAGDWFGPWETFWIMIQKEKKCGVGLIGFKGRPDTRGVVEVGYGIAPAWRRKGLTTEALLGMLEWAFAQTDCTTVTADCLQTNKASIRVLEKAGFRMLGKKNDLLMWVKKKPVSSREQDVK